MADDQAPRPVFSRAVEFPFPGTRRQAQAIAASVAALPPAKELGAAVHRGAACSSGCSVGDGWSAAVQRVRAGGRASSGPAKHITKRYDVPPKIRTGAPPPSVNDDGDGEGHDANQAPRPPRLRVPKAKVLVED